MDVLGEVNEYLKGVAKEQELRKQLLDFIAESSNDCISLLSPVAKGDPLANPTETINKITRRSNALEQTLNDAGLDQLVKYLPEYKPEIVPVDPDPVPDPVPVSVPDPVPDPVFEPIVEEPKCLKCGSKKDLIKVSCNKCVYCSSCLIKYDNLFLSLI